MQATAQKPDLLNELLQQVEGMETAIHEFTGMKLELIDKNQVIKLIKDMKE